MLFPIHTSSVPLLMDPPFILLLTVIAAGLGRRALCFLGARLQNCTRLERAVITLVSGFGLMALGPFALGCFGLLKPAPIWTLLALLGIALSRDIVACVRSGVAAVRSHNLEPTERAVLIILALFLLALLPQTLSPPSDSDGVGYHLPAPRYWLTSGWLHYLQHFHHTNNPMGQQMLYAICQGVWSDTAAKMVHFVMGCLALFATYCLGRRVGGSMVGLSAAALFLLGIPMLAAQVFFTWAYVDLAVAAAMVTACLAWCIWRESPSSGHIRLVGLLAGITLSFKLHGLLSGIVLGGLCYVHMGSAISPSARFKQVLSLLAVGAIPSVPWLARSWYLTGNPTYPVLDFLFKTRDMTHDNVARFQTNFRYEVWGTSALFKDLSLSERQMLLIAVGIGLVGACTWVMRTSSNRDLKGVTVFVTSMLLLAVATTGLYLRYMLPFYPLVWIILMTTVLNSPQRERNVLKWLPLWCGGLSMLHLVSFHPQQSLDKHMVAIRSALGLISRDDALGFLVPDYGVIHDMNAKLPKDAVLMALSAFPFYYTDRKLVMLRGEWITLATWDEYVDFWNRSGATHLVINSIYLTDNTGGAMMHPSIMFARRLAAEFGEVAFESSGIRVVHINRKPSTGTKL